MPIRIYLLFVFLIFFHNNAKAQQSPVDLYTGNSFGLQGDTVSIDIKVDNFTDIISFQASLNWDSGLLKYISISDYGIKDLGENNFGTIKADQGHVRFLWEPSNATALTIEDGTILFSAQFEIVTNTPQVVPISFTDKISSPPYPIEFANSTYEILTINTHPGNIKVTSDLKEVVNLESTPFSSCDKKAPNGSLKADVNGDSVNYTFHWFIGDSVTLIPDYIGHRYNNISAGAYTLQIFDGNNDLFVESITAAVLDESNQQKDVISVISSIPQTSCSTSPERQTGSIEINVNDAQPADTFLISWWEGRFEDGQELTDFRNLYKTERLFTGDYEVAVENKSNGCKAYLKKTIMEEKVDVQITLSSTGNNFCKSEFNGSASVSITTPNNLDPRYYRFFSGDEIDTTKSRFTGQDYENIIHGNYKAMVIDLNSDCYALDSIVVEQNEIYAEAFVTQKNDTLFANDDQANWFRNNIFLQKTGYYLIPEESGLYYITINNEYGCLSTSESLFYGITGLEELNAEIKIFPNPFNEFIRISNNSGLLDFVKIYDLQGTLISENYNIENKFTDVHLSGSSNGIYFIKIRKNRKLLTRKIVKNLPK